jgi:threonine/homoserine/homoserine lactone efflux protein
MGQAIGDILLLAVAVAVFPVPVIAVVLLLVGPRGTTNGLAFALGWLLGLTAVGAIALLVAPGGSEDAGSPATWLSLVLLALGVVSLALAVRQWRARPRDGESAAMPAWLGAISGFTPPRALGAGAALSGLNPKNVLLSVAAAAEIVQTGIPGGQQAIAYAVFVVIATIGVATPIVVALALGERSTPLLARVEGWMAQNSAVIMTVLLLLIGAKLVGDAVAGLSA